MYLIPVIVPELCEQWPLADYVNKLHFSYKETWLKFNHL